MNLLKALSILTLIIGAIAFFAGIYVYWVSNPVPVSGPILVMMGLLFLFGSIMFLCVGQQYDTKP